MKFAHRFGPWSARAIFVLVLMMSIVWLSSDRSGAIGRRLQEGRPLWQDPVGQKSKGPKTREGASKQAEKGASLAEPDALPGASAKKEFVRADSVMRRFEELRAKARDGRTVRVIVGMRVEFQSEGRLASAQEVAEQHARIAVAAERLLNSVSGYSRSSVKRYETLPFVAFEVNESGLEQLRASDQVTSIEEDDWVEPSLSESTLLIGAPGAWAAGYSGAGQTIAILDTGVDKTHPFLAGKVISEACYSTNSSNSVSVCPGGVTESTSSGAGVNCAANVDGCDHGTHVAGIAAGKGTNFSGVARDANLIAIQVFSRFDSQNSCGSRPAPCTGAFNSDVIKGLDRVATLKASVNIAAVNLSLGGGRFFSACDTDNVSYSAAISNLRSLGVATAAASGNDGYSDAMGRPACISTAISVGSTDDGSAGTAVDAVSPFSNSASFLSLLAPGRSITSSLPKGGFGAKSGTSMATPHVAGAWAVLKSAAPNATVNQVLAALTATGVAIRDTRNGITKPRIRLDAAVNALIGGNCVYTISPTNQTISSGGGAGSVTVSTANNCSWQATSNVSWITVTAGASGTGNGSVSFSVQAHTGSNARTGTLTIAGQTFTVNQQGSGTNPCNTVKPITVGQQINESLSPGDCQFSDGTYVDFYGFSAIGGQQIAISMNSSAFDTYLFLYDPNGSLIASNDDGGGGTNSRIPPGSGFFTLPATGNYIIAANSYFGGETGSYAISLTSQSNTGGGNVITLVPGQPQSSSIPAAGFGGGVLGSTQFTIQVPNGAGQLVVTLDSGQDVDLYIRFGQRIELSGGRPIADHYAESFGGTETIVVNQYSTPPLQSGIYYIAAANFGSSGATISVTATIGSPPTGTPTELSVDDGTLESALVISQGGTSYAVNRLTPPTYPATLSAMKINFPAAFGARVGDLFTIQVGANIDGDAEISGTTFQTVTARVRVLDEFVTYAVPQVSIGSGDFVVGLRMTVGSGVFPFAYDNNSGSRQRSYFSSNGFQYLLIDGFGSQFRGNFGIRAIASTAQPCAYNIAPASQNFSASGGSGTINVTTQTGCAWTAASNDGFISITSPTGPGTGNGAVAFTVAANSGGPRTGTMTIAGQTFTVTQDGVASNPAPTMGGISPNSATAGSPGFTLTVNGANFVNTSVVRWNGDAKSTTLVSGGQLTAQISAAEIASPGSASVTVFTPGPGGGTSAAASFTINPQQTTSRVVRVGQASGSPGSTVLVPIELVSLGDENALGFSMTFDPATLSAPQVALGSGASQATLNVNASQVGSGRIGVTMSLPSGQVFAAGVRQLLAITLNIAQGASGTSTPIGFGDQPIFREISGAAANVLPANYMTGAVGFTRGYEADVAPRPNGSNNGTVTVTDWVQVGRFVSGEDVIPAGSEFQRADCAPKETLGNGALTVTDWVQAGRYAAGFDPIVAAGGPAGPVTTAARGNAGNSPAQASRIVRVGQANLERGQSATVAVEMDAQGNENALGFSLQFDASQLTFVSRAVGTGLAGATLNINSSQAAQGRIGIVLGMAPGQSIPSGLRQLVQLTFTAAASGNLPTTRIEFGDQPVGREVADVSAGGLAASFTGSAVSLVRSVASVSAASFAGASLAPEAIVAAFGTRLASSVEVAATLPLPTSLGGTGVLVTDSAGIERAAPIFFVAPSQINYQLPAGMAPGAATVTITSGDGTISTGKILVAETGPGLFSANASGQGVAAATALRVKPDGTLLYEPVSRFDAAQNRAVPIPIDLGPETDQVFLILNGTGIRGRSALSAVTAAIGGLASEVLYAGPQGGFVGLDQVNLRLPRPLAGRGEVDLQLTVDGRAANAVRISVK